MANEYRVTQYTVQVLRDSDSSSTKARVTQVTFEVLRSLTSKKQTSGCSITW
jgi:hypothetical protein